MSVEIDQSHSVAFIITHIIKEGEEKRYESWLEDILTKCSKSPGYLGREIFPPIGNNRTYTSIVRFDSQEHLNAWAKSDTRKSYVKQVEDLLEKGDVYEIHTGIDFWFKPKSERAPKRWKQCVLTATAVYPLTLLIPLALTPLFNAVPILGNKLISGLFVTPILTGLLTYVIMPNYTNLMKRWLYEE